EGRGCLCGREGAVPLSRGGVLGGVLTRARGGRPFGIEAAARGFVGPPADSDVNAALAFRHADVMSAVYYDLQVAMRSVCRHDGHCDEATPDERAPFRVWSFLF